MQNSLQVQSQRIATIDVLRGLVMALMLVDHVRESFFAHHPVADPMALASTPPALFFTRMAAHFCAPVFVFLTGLSAWLYAHPASGPRDASGFLLKRGLLLVLLELTLVNFAWYGQWPPATFYLQVIWVIGLAMLALAALHRLPLRWLAAGGALIVCGHNAVSGLRLAPDDAGYALWTLLLQRGYLLADGALQIKVSYPLLPWIGVILLGYAAGPLYAASMPAQRRRQLLTLAGALALLTLVLLRGSNLYGEAQPWGQGADALSTLMSMLNFSKYPPSLDYLLLTLGGAALLAAALEGHAHALTRYFATLGSAPMFFYLLHLLVLLLLQKLLVLQLGPNHGSRWGLESVWQLWLLALLLLLALYPLCARFATYKRRSPQAWLRYF
ncbi:heparan-alpha-glucosaminide N-acetyltransferase domain-containing protein [Duganella fentianensis]|uniref:DUF1624 domain-containing protein n=1 Tax=Duganella fentianensis TaxID=2692177 RepID=UPI0032B302D0